MASLFHLIFEFFRITILSAIYGYILSKIIKSDRAKMTALIGFVFISMFFWRFSYWRNNGLGDSYRVPLTSKYELQMIDLQYGTIVSSEFPAFKEGSIGSINKIYCDNNRIYAKTDKDLVIINPENKSFKALNEKEFIKSGGNLDKLQKLESFHSNHFSWFTLLFL